MKPSISCTLPTLQTSCEIVFGQGILNDAKTLAHHLKMPGHRYAIITDESLAREYGEPLLSVLQAMGAEAHLLMFPAGEKHKTRETKASLEDAMLKLELGSDTCIITLGGGVTTDLGGYIAATYCRGVPLITIPTSLMGMVDASIGGKNGVNTSHGKNMLGTIYSPKKVLIDTNCLRTLPLTELRNGIVEMIKHGLVADRMYFEFLESRAHDILDVDIMEQAIYQSCKIKAEVVTKEEKGLRNILNFGHTFGHAIELVTEYSIPHGEAVALGILAESHIAMQLGKLTRIDLDKIREIFNKYGIHLKMPRKELTDKLLQAMALDKKSVEGTPRFVILNGIGTPDPCSGAYCRAIEASLIRNAITQEYHALCCD